MKKDWFRQRSYRHISNSITSDRRSQVLGYVSNRKQVAKHSFLPFILDQRIQRRYKKDPERDGIRSHSALKNGVKVSTKKVRPIMYAAHLDAHIYAYYAKEILTPAYEAVLSTDPELNRSITAYRSLPTGKEGVNKNNRHFAKELFDEIKKRQNCTVLLFDIENFFPTLDHTLLKKSWYEVLGYKSLPKDHYNLFKSVSKYSFINLKSLREPNGHFDERELSGINKLGKHSFFRSVKDFLESGVPISKNPFDGRGIPQGLPISATLANIYMLPFDRRIVNLGRELDLFYRRYSDDLVVVCNSYDASKIEQFVLEEIKNVKLKISEDKTERKRFKADPREGLICLEKISESNEVKSKVGYLGFTFDGENIRIKEKNLSGFYRQMKQAIATKNRRAEAMRDLHLSKNQPIFKRKLYRLYTFKGVKGRKIYFNQNSKSTVRKYRGNFIKYAYRSAEIMEAPEIKKQVRNHWKILQKTVNKYGFSNE